MVKIAFYNGDSRNFTFDIQTSTDGSNWIQARNTVTSAQNNQPQSFPIPVVEARYVRIVGYGNTSMTGTVTLRSKFGEVLRMEEVEPLTRLNPFGQL